MSRICVLELPEPSLTVKLTVRVAVLGVPDARWGQVGLAVVATDAPLPPDALQSWARARLAGYKTPRHFRFVESLPRNATGKVQKVKLREIYKDFEFPAQA